MFCRMLFGDDPKNTPPSPPASPHPLEAGGPWDFNCLPTFTPERNPKIGHMPCMECLGMCTLDRFG